MDNNILKTTNSNEANQVTSMELSIPISHKIKKTRDGNNKEKGEDPVNLEQVQKIAISNINKWVIGQMGTLVSSSFNILQNAKS